MHLGNTFQYILNILTILKGIKRSLGVGDMKKTSSLIYSLFSLFILLATIAVQAEEIKQKVDVNFTLRV